MSVCVYARALVVQEVILLHLQYVYVYSGKYILQLCACLYGITEKKLQIVM